MKLSRCSHATSTALSLVFYTRSRTCSLESCIQKFKPQWRISYLKVNRPPIQNKTKRCTMTRLAQCSNSRSTTRRQTKMIISIRELSDSVTKFSYAQLAMSISFTLSLRTLIPLMMKHLARLKAQLLHRPTSL